MKANILLQCGQQVLNTLLCNHLQINICVDSRIVIFFLIQHVITILFLYLSSPAKFSVEDYYWMADMKGFVRAGQLDKITIKTIIYYLLEKQL